MSALPQESPFTKLFVSVNPVNLPKAIIQLSPEKAFNRRFTQIYTDRSNAWEASAVYKHSLEN